MLLGKKLFNILLEISMFILSNSQAKFNKQSIEELNKGWDEKKSFSVSLGNKSQVLQGPQILAFCAI